MGKFIRRGKVTGGEDDKAAIVLTAALKEMNESKNGSGLLRLGLGQTVKNPAFFPQATGLEELDTLAALEHAALGGGRATGRSETAMLGHRLEGWGVSRFGAGSVTGKEQGARSF
jgi:hypothetical protein